MFATGRNPEALDTLRSNGLHAQALDVTDEAAVSVLVEEINADHGGVDVLVNSAGYPLPCPLEQVELSELRRLFETNVVATLHLSQAVLPGMRARGYGRIVTIGSTGGRFTSPGAGAYHTVKYAVEALSLSLGAEVAPFGVRVVLIDPTGVRTPFVTSQFDTVHSYPDDDPVRRVQGPLLRNHPSIGDHTVERRSMPTRWPAPWFGSSRPETPNPATSSGRPGKPPCSLVRC